MHGPKSYSLDGPGEEAKAKRKRESMGRAGVNPGRRPG